MNCCLCEPCQQKIRDAQLNAADEFVKVMREHEAKARADAAIEIAKRQNPLTLWDVMDKLNEIQREFLNGLPKGK